MVSLSFSYLSYLYTQSRSNKQWRVLSFQTGQHSQTQRRRHHSRNHYQTLDLNSTKLQSLSLQINPHILHSTLSSNTFFTSLHHHPNRSAADHLLKSTTSTSLLSNPIIMPLSRRNPPPPPPLQLQFHSHSPSHHHSLRAS